ncbi:retrovirus-related pol polyprotein from transposon TNT 1-94 [Tanacetum coccineum]
MLYSAAYRSLGVLQVGSDNGSTSSELEARVCIQGELLDGLKSVLRKKHLTTESAVHFQQRELQQASRLIFRRKKCSFLEAINDEMDSILGNQTWEIAELLKDVKPIGSKWVFKKKLNPDGSISTFKARLVAEGYKQREGLDYFDTYALIARISSIRTLIAISAI